MQTDPGWLYIPDDESPDALYDWELETQSIAAMVMDVATPNDNALYSQFLQDVGFA